MGSPGVEDLDMVALLGSSRRVDGRCRERGEDAVTGASEGRKEWSAVGGGGVIGGYLQAARSSLASVTLLRKLTLLDARLPQEEAELGCGQWQGGRET
jgi:hypothetical protein